MALPDLGAVHIVEATCVDCATKVTRAVGFDGQRDDWRTHVLCSHCRKPEDDAEAVWRATLDNAANERLRARIRAFDAAAGYEHAALDDPQVHDKKWAKAARTAVQTCFAATDPPGREGLMLVGPTGIGKTWAAFAVCHEIARIAGPDSVRFAAEEELFGAETAPWELKKRLGEWLDGAAVAFVDDIGVATRNPDQVLAGWKQLCSMISGHPTPLMIIGTTNRQGWDGEAGLTAWLGAQAASRLRQWARQEYTTGWTDRRTDQVHERWKAHLTGR
ncbi:MAG: AAA family ATPase [Candidatus Nanopelagicales bacterium]